MPHQTERPANYKLGEILQGMIFRGQAVYSENTQTILAHAGLQVDILITAPGRSPVVIESEVMPAREAELDAKARLGLTVNDGGRVIEAAIALRYPLKVRDTNIHTLESYLRGANLSWCVFTQPSEGVVERFPQSGWLTGGVEDLADLVRLVSVPQRAVEQAADTLQEGIEVAAKMLGELSKTRDGITREIARLLGMSDVPQTRRMACAIIANALVFHERIAGMPHGIKPLAAVCGDNVLNPQSETLAAWNAILDINYWAIFAIATDILGQLPSGDATSVLRRLRDTAQSVHATGVDNSHDLTGRIFQKLIADRKYLATYYTLPASAALLARLAVARMEGVDWSSVEAVGKLRVADFACGTGALLSAVYDRIAARYEGSGGSDTAALHKVMMEEVLYGWDVMPSAVHITGSTLSGMEPSVLFDKSRLYTAPYGRMKDGKNVAIGSLELLEASDMFSEINTSDPAMRTGSAGEETAARIRAEIPHESCDLVIMNPPFTRAGSDWEGSERTQDAVKQFRGLSTTLVTQKDMAKRLGRYTKDTCYHGYAGIASAFAALAHRKLKPGGILALVLPLSAANGLSWEAFREMLARQYADVEVLSIASNGNDMAFSADTGMAECLVVARKLRLEERPQDAANFTERKPKLPDRVRFTSLLRRPQNFAHASSIANEIQRGGQIRRIEAGPYEGTPLKVGEEAAGQTITVPSSQDGAGWGAVRIKDYSLSQTAYALSHSMLWLPGQHSSMQLKIAALSALGNRGLHHINIAGSSGPFTKEPPSPTATYPALWNHNAQSETRVVCSPDSQLLVRQGMEDKAATVWKTASRAHLNLDFRFNSQPLTVAFTEERTIGGTAWPNAVFSDTRFDFALCVWGNSTLGLLSYWWHSSRQQSGRGRTTISAVDSLPVLDFRTLTDAQLAKAEEIFEEFRDKELQPAYLADADPNRALLDKRVVCDLLGFDEETYAGVRRLAKKWCAEPSVHGGKARPKGAKPVI